MELRVKLRDAKTDPPEVSVDPVMGVWANGIVEMCSPRWINRHTGKLHWADVHGYDVKAPQFWFRKDDVRIKEAEDVHR